DMDAIDRADVDNAGGIFGPTGLFQQRQKVPGQEEDPLDVGIHHFVPARFREFFERRSPCSAGIVDENIELWLARLYFVREEFTSRGRRKVGRDRRTLADFGQPECSFVDYLFLARRDIYAGAGFEVSASDHESDAARSAGHQRDFALD